MRPLIAGFLLLLASFAGCAQQPATTADHLAGNTVLIVRHAEKPVTGRTLTPAGEARARAYIHYFEPFHEDGFNLSVNALYAGADSDNSIRPRLTLEPLSRATGLPLDTTVDTKEPELLVQQLRKTSHGDHPLIAWRHGQIPALLKSLGASTDALPDGKWPDEVFDWVFILTFDSQGRLQSQKMLKEHLIVPSS